MIPIILVVWGLTSAGLIAIGKTVFKQASYPEALISGFCLLLPLLTLIHLFAPINLVLFALLSAAGLIWLALHRPSLRLNRSTVGFAVVILVLAVLATRYALDYDDGLYHLQITSWYSSYAVVPGLANLHSRFGFNSTYYLYAALFNGLPGGALSYTSGPLWIAVFGLCSGSRFGKLLLLPLGLWASYVSTLTNDFPILLLTLALGLALFELIQHRKQNFGYLILIVFLGSTIKLSFAFFAFPALALAFYLERPALKSIVAPAIIGAVGMLLWMVHGVFLSSYPLYPLTVASLNVDWRLPQSVAISESAWIAAWAKAPGTSTTQIVGNWIPAWWQESTFNLDLSLPLIFALFTLPFALIRRRQRPPLLFFIPLVIGLALWFYTAPDVRFAAGMIWLISSVLLYAVVSQRRDRTLFRVIYALSLIFCLVNLVPITVNAVRYTTFSVDNQPIYVPIDDDRCFDHALPCAAYQSSVDTLALRVPGNLAQGFRSQP